MEVIAAITVGSNVFIGVNSIILPGVTIGDNVVIGAGSVVTRDIPSGVVAAGCPARPLRSIDEYLRTSKERATYTRDRSVSGRDETEDHRGRARE